MPDYEAQHFKYFFKGYREKVLERLYGEQEVEDMGIDTQRYSPDSARRFSYDEGRKKAQEDCAMK